MDAGRLCTKQVTTSTEMAGQLLPTSHLSACCHIFRTQTAKFHAEVHNIGSAVCGMHSHARRKAAQQVE
jgi:hypothetical protein